MMMTALQRHVFFAVALLAVLLFPDFVADATAQTTGPRSIDEAGLAVDFSCQGGAASGKLFDTGADKCDPLGIETMFSHFVCTYENIVSEVLGNVFCAMQDALFQPLGAVMTLFVVLLGAAVLVGVTPFTTRDMVFALFKFGLVFYFASDATLTIGILYKGLMGFIQESVVVVLRVLGEPGGAPIDSVSGPNGVLHYLDDVFKEFFNKNAISQEPATKCEKGLIAFVMSLLAAVPTVAMFTIGMAIQLFLALFRAIVGYLISITGIMFLLTLAPIFLSFGLFKITQSYFAKWVQYLVSFSIQMFVVFGVIGMVLALDIAQDLRSLFDTVRPFSEVKEAHGVRNPIKEWCSICEHEFVDEALTERSSGTALRCTSDKAVDPVSLTMDPEFLKFVIITLGKIFILAFIINAALTAAPSIAQALGAVAYAPTLGYLRQGDLMSAEAGASRFGAAFGKTPGSTYDKALGAIGPGWAGLMRGDPATGRPGILNELFQGMIGARKTP